MDIQNILAPSFIKTLYIRDINVDSFVKNAGLGFAIPYFLNGQMHDYIPDFIVRLKGHPAINLIFEVKGYDPLAEVKRAAAERWVAAVNAKGSYGKWAFKMVKATTEVNGVLSGIAQPAEAVGA
ncbi:MAG: hypothetical protein ACLPPV_18430 [Candidatus Korobacteraceae bacterium]|jgi:type III restriction enzyme